MPSIEKLRAVKHIVTHENCPDGIASAMILKTVLPDAKVTFLQYETNGHKTLEPEEGMLFCDFSPHKSRVLDFKEAGAIVLDHHKTQKEVVATFGELGVFADEKTEPGVCGATLAFREVWSPLMVHHPKQPQPAWGPAQNLATLAGIRDTWQTNDPRWKQACEQAEALAFWPIEGLLGLAPEQWGPKLELGPVLYERKLSEARKCIEHGVSFTTRKGRKVLVFEGLKQTSDAAELLGDKYDFVVGFGFTPENNVPALVYSTRSRGGFDCSAFCQAHGGGGHTAAAGFKVALNYTSAQPFTILPNLMSVYESVEETWLKTLAERKEGFDAPKEYQKLLGTNIQESYLVHLDRYQRDNLVWLLAACGAPVGPQTIVPFVFANTGDWIGEIAGMLECHKGVGKPNTSHADLRERIKLWHGR